MRRPGEGVGGGGGSGGAEGGGERPEQDQPPPPPQPQRRPADPEDDDSASASDGGDSDGDVDFEPEGDGAAAVANGSDGAASLADGAVAGSEQSTAAFAAVSAGALPRTPPTTPETLSPKASSPSGGAASAGGGGGGGGDGSGDGGPGAGAGPRATPAPRDPTAPTALERVLEQLGILPQSRGGEAAAAAEMEHKYRAVALAARADAQTLPLRLERQARLREQAEKNVTAEADELARALHRLNYLCKEAESVELLGAAREQIHFVLRASKYVAATAETMGALRLEARMSAWMEASLTYADSLKQQLETVRSEHEELRRVLTESGASLDTNLTQGPSPRRPVLSSKLQLSSPRRASIAVPTRPATSVSPGTGIKDQGRLSLAFIPGSNSQSTTVLRSGRRPLSSASSDTTVGGNGIDGAAPSPPIVPDDFQPLTEDAMPTPLEDDAVDLGNRDEPIPHRNSIPRLSAAGLPDPESEALSVPHIRRRESAAVTAVAAFCPPTINSVQSARSLYRTTAAEMLEYIWPPDFLVLAQHARWLLVRLLVLAAVWCVVQAFMSPADAHMQYPPLSTCEVNDGDTSPLLSK